MGLMDTLQMLIDLCISIQESLSHLIDMLGNQMSFNKSMIDLSAIDVIALEKNVALLAGYKEDVDYIIGKLTELSGNIRLLFWLIVSIAVLVLALAIYLVALMIFENRQKIFNIFERKSENEKSSFN